MQVKRWSIRWARVAVAVVVGGQFLGMTGCALVSSEPTVKDYCSFFYNKGSEFRQRYIDASNNQQTDPLGGIVTALGAPGDLASFFHGLADNSPKDIRADVQTVGDAFQKQADSLASGNPLTVLGAGLGSAVGSSAAMQRVDTYTNKNCGPPPRS